MAFITAETRSDLIELSVAMLKQAPSAALLEELIALSVGGGSLADAADHIATTAAFKAEYPSFQTAEQYAAEIFDNITTGGTVTADIRTAVIELATGMLTSGSVTKAGLALAIAEYLAAPAALLNTDFADIAQSFQNRADAAEYFVVTKELGGSTDAELAAAIASVTSDAATLTAANTAADATASAEAVVAGQTITLTTGLDTGSSFTGASTDDTFSAQENVTATTDTLTTGDNLTGGAGTDTLSIAVSGVAPGTTAGIVTSSIEAISVYNNSTAAYTVDAALMPGVTNVYVNGGANATTFSGLDTLANLHLISTSQNATVTATATSVAGTADEAIVLSNGAAQAGSMTATYDGLEVINFNAAGTTGSSSLSLTLAGADLEKIVVTGDAAANLTASFVGAALDTQTATFDASAAGGAITASITKGASENAAVTMSDQSDTLTFAGALSENTVLVGGDGVDTLILNTDVAYDEDETTQTGSGVSGFEVLRLSGGTDVDELSLTNNAGITNVVALGAGSYKNATALTTLTQGVTGAFVTDLATDGSADALAVNLVSSAAGGGAVTSTLTAADVETMTVSSTGTAANVLTMSAAGSLDLTSITASGTVGLTLTIGGVALATVDASGVSGTSNAFVLDASASEADMTVTGSSVRPAVSATGTADTITTGSGDDTITGGEYKDVISAGAGDDTIVGGDGDNNLTGGAGDDTITGGAGKDTISDGAGDDTVVGGAGVDTITMGAGSDDIDAGAGKDVIAAGANLSSGDDIDGGTEADTLTATISGVGIAPTIANVETISFGFGASTYIDMVNITGATALVIDSATAGGAAAQIKSLATGLTITVTDEGTLAGTGNLTSLTVDTVADATVGVKIAANAAAATPAATSLTGLTFTDAAVVNITNVGGAVDNVLDHQITGNLILDDTETTGLSITSSAYGAIDLTANTITNTSALTSFTVSAAAGGDITIDPGVLAATDALDDAEELQTISVSASGASSDVSIGEIGNGTASTALTSVTLAASAGGTIDIGGIDASANLSTVTITADGANSDVTQGNEITTAGGGISAVTITASDRANIDMTAGDLTVGAGLIGAIAISAAGRASIDLNGFAATSTATTTAGAYSLTTGTRGSIDMGTSDISTNGSLTSLTVTVGEDSTLDATTGVISAAGTIGSTSISVGADAATSGQINIGEGTTVYTAASINLSADAANLADIDLIGATATKLTVTLDGSTAITVATDSVTFDGNAGAIDYSAVTTTTALVFNASASTGTNSLDFSAGGVAKVTVSGGTGADTIVGTTGKDVISGGAGADPITGGTGADTITGGTGSDAFVHAQGDSIAATVVTDATTSAAIAATVVLAAGDTITFGSGVDVYTDFTAGAVASGGDTLNTTTAGLPTTMIGVAHDTLAAADDLLFVSGAFVTATGVFTIAADGTGADTLIIDLDQGTSDDIDGTTNAVVLVGVDSDDLVAANFI